MRRMKLGLAALGCGALLLCMAPARATATDPYQIFAQARDYWLHQHYPVRLDYDVAVDVVEGGKERVEHYASDFDAVDNVISVDPVSDYEQTHPVRPTGINIGLLGLRVGKPLPPVDFIGVPHLAPNYSFGMAPFVAGVPPRATSPQELVDEIRKEFHDPNPRTKPTPSAQPSPGLTEIASVVVFKRDYTITMLDPQSVDGHACYHLALQPTHDPTRLRIRQAWIDERTYATWKLVDALNFTDGPGTSVPWTIHFTDVDGAHYVSEEDANAAFATAGEIYTQTAVRFEKIRAVDRPSFSAPIAASGTIVVEP